MTSVLVTVPEGLGDAIQTLPVLRSLSVSSAAVTVVINDSYRDLFVIKFGLIAKFYTWEAIKSRGKNSNYFDIILDLRGLTPMAELSEVLSYGHIIRHTLFIDPEIKNGANCIYVNRLDIGSKFFNAEGVIPAQAWTFYVDMLECLYDFKGSIRTSIESMSQVSERIKNGITSSEIRDKSDSIALLPCGTLDSKKWPLMSYLGLADLLVKNGFLCNFYLGPNERDETATLSAVNSHLNVKVELDLVSLATDLFNSRLVIANDCGPMHLAAVMGCPIVAIFRATLPQCWFPYRGTNQEFIGGPEFSGPYVSTFHATDHTPSQDCVFGLVRSLLKF